MHLSEDRTCFRIHFFIFIAYLHVKITWHMPQSRLQKKKKAILYDVFSTINIFFPQMLIPKISDFVIFIIKKRFNFFQGRKLNKNEQHLSQEKSLWAPRCLVRRILLKQALQLLDKLKPQIKWTD